MMLLPFRRYFDFSGRSRRREFWLFTLFWYLVTIGCGVLMLAGIPWDKFGSNAQPGFMLWVGMSIMMLFWLVSWIPGIAVTVRRFHDQGLSGWMYLLYFIPYLGWLIVMVFMCIEGNRGENRFGYDPKGLGTAEIFA